MRLQRPSSEWSKLVGSLLLVVAIGSGGCVNGSPATDTVPQCPRDTRAVASSYEHAIELEEAGDAKLSPMLNHYDELWNYCTRVLPAWQSGDPWWAKLMGTAIETYGD